jgi:hypothetical protein
MSTPSQKARRWTEQSTRIGDPLASAGVLVQKEANLPYHSYDLLAPSLILILATIRFPTTIQSEPVSKAEFATSACNPFAIR